MQFSASVLFWFFVCLFVFNWNILLYNGVCFLLYNKVNQLYV